MCSGLALVDAQIAMYDNLVGSNVRLVKVSSIGFTLLEVKSSVVDPGPNRIRIQDHCGSGSVCLIGTDLDQKLEAKDVRFKAQIHHS